MSNYRSLEIWQNGCQFAKEVYISTSGWNDYGLRDQVTRSAVSISSNIAEGSERESDADFARFLRIAKGSCAECQTQLIIARLVGMLDKEKFEDLEQKAVMLSKGIGALVRYLKKKP